MTPYQVYMLKVAEERSALDRTREVAIDVGAGLIANRGMGGASVVGSALTNTVDYLTMRAIAEKALDRLVQEPSQASMS